MTCTVRLKGQSRDANESNQRIPVDVKLHKLLRNGNNLPVKFFILLGVGSKLQFYVGMMFCFVFVFVLLHFQNFILQTFIL